MDLSSRKIVGRGPLAVGHYKGEMDHANSCSDRELTRALCSRTASAVSIDRVTVGDPGNAANSDGVGSAGNSYRISKYEVTNTQYAEFLNAVGSEDNWQLYDSTLGNSPLQSGTTRSGSFGNYSYNTVAGRENLPVNYVTFDSALRFANWLHNGQPTGLQTNATTEDGAYSFVFSPMAPPNFPKLQR
ncbi:MAG: SUMF1/EgtB/PvdO family nonheme iron enzyme [Myxococcales bacterium]|nr:hypothetical protein [Myxococcales bacterium]HIL79834.1 hypothetical protein [Myxococcales bacterium]